MANPSHRVAFNHATFGPEIPFRDFLTTVAATAAKGVGVWTERLDGLSPRAAAQMVRDFGLEISGVNRGGFFTGAATNDRRAAIEDTLRRIEDTAELGADTLVIVPGGLPASLCDIDSARAQVRDGIARFLNSHWIMACGSP